MYINRSLLLLVCFPSLLTQQPVQLPGFPVLTFYFVSLFSLSIPSLVIVAILSHIHTDTPLRALVLSKRATSHSDPSITLMKDHTYEERKYKIPERIQQQQDLLRIVDRSHVAQFPNEVINNSDHKDWCFIHNLKNPIPKMGPQFVKAHGVAPVGLRAVKWNLRFGVKHIRAKIRGLKAAQLKWEEMQ